MLNKQIFIAALMVFRTYVDNNCMLICSEHSTAHLHDILELIDLPSLDLANYQYFKNFPSQNPKTAAHANLVLEHFQKKKAVMDYVENLFFGNSPFHQESEIAFDPHYGRYWRPHYAGKYGWRGERLIAMLGQGMTFKQLKQHGAIPKEFGSYGYPS